MLKSIRHLNLNLSEPNSTFSFVLQLQNFSKIAIINFRDSRIFPDDSG